MLRVHAWVMGRGDYILPLMGTPKLENLKANLGACGVQLSAEEQASLDALADRVKGDRYDEWGSRASTAEPLRSCL